MKFRRKRVINVIAAKPAFQTAFRRSFPQIARMMFSSAIAASRREETTQLQPKKGRSKGKNVSNTVTATSTKSGMSHSRGGTKPRTKNPTSKVSQK